MVFKDAALTPEEMPRTTPVPRQHGRMPTGVTWRPLEPTADKAVLPGGRAVHLDRYPAVDEALEVDPLAEDLMVVNIGPSHPAMHGTFRIKLWLDGETIVKAIPEIG